MPNTIICEYYVHISIAVNKNLVISPAQAVHNGSHLS